MKQNHWTIYAVLILLAFIWGTSFILMKFGMRAYSSSEVAALRILIACICLLPIALPRLKSIGWKNFWKVSLAGLLGSGIPAFLFTYAQTKLDSSTVGVLNSTVPIFTLIIGVWWFKDPFNMKRMIGVALGMTGALLLILLRGNGTFDPNFAYGFYVIAATFCYGLNVNYIKYSLSHLPSLSISAISFTLMGPFMLYYLLMHTEFIHTLSTHEQGLSSLLYVGLLAAVGTAFAIVIFNYLIRISHPVFAASVTYMIPIVALLWGALDGEALGYVHLIGMGTILTGVYLTNRKGRKIKPIPA